MGQMFIEELIKRLWGRYLRDDWMLGLDGDLGALG